MQVFRYHFTGFFCWEPLSIKQALVVDVYKRQEKKRARYVEAILSVLDEIEKNENENADQVSVRALMNRAKAKIREQDAKRKRAADKAAASRRKAKRDVYKRQDMYQGSPGAGAPPLTISGISTIETARAGRA